MSNSTLQLETAESKYRLLLSWRFSNIDFLGLPNFQDDRPVSLESLYVNTRLSLEPDSQKYVYLAAALRRCRHLVVLGDPGSGKSTLVQMIAYSLSRTEPTPLSRAIGGLLPIPIVLRDYKVRSWNNARDMLNDFVQTLESEVREHITPEWLLDTLKAGKGVLLLDGLDEVGTVEERRHLRDQVIAPALPEIAKSLVILTSRIVGYDEVSFDSSGTTVEQRENSLFRRSYIAPFGDNEIREYVQRWYSLREPNAIVRRAGIDSLIASILQNSRIRELARRPGLLTLMALIHRVTGTLPLDRLKLYEKIVEAYLESLRIHRKLPGVSARLDAMKRWLSLIGWKMQCLSVAQDSELTASRSDVIEIISQAAEDEMSEDASFGKRFLDYVTQRAGLLVMRGPDRVAFAHLSFQEFFAAWYLRSSIRRFDDLADQCGTLIKDSRWHETLILLFGMLSEFHGAADDLARSLLSKAKHDALARIETADFFTRLLASGPDQVRISRKEIIEFIFATWFSGELHHVVDLKIFFRQFEKEFEQWALQQIEQIEPADRTNAEKNLLQSFVRLGDALATLGASGDAFLAYQKSVNIAERLAAQEPNRADFLRNLSVSYERMGDSLQNLGQGEQARSFRQKALELCERLAAQEPNRADFLRDLSISYNKMGDSLQNLGQGEQARSFFQKALELRERLAAKEPDRADFLRDLSISYNKMGDSLQNLGQGDQARSFFQKSLELRERLAAQKPDRTDFLRDLSVSYERMGDSLQQLGQGDQARSFFQKALELRERLAAQEPDRADFLRDLSVSYEKMGDSLQQLGQGEQARSFFQKALELRERLAAQEPDRADFLRDLSISYEKMGDSLQQLGQGDQARSFFQKALEICERLAAQEPDRADFLRDLSVFYNKMGNSLQQLGQGEQARSFFHKALEIRERLAAQEPDRADFLRDLSVSYEKMGDSLQQLDQGEQARSFFHKALEIRERLVAQEPDRADFLRDLSVSYNKVGDSLQQFGQAEQARSFFQKDLEIAERLAAQEPDRADFLRDLSVSYEKMGDSLQQLGQGDQARSFFQNALEIRERLAAQEPDRADFLRDLSVSYNKMGDSLQQLGHGEQAHSLFQKALELRERLATREAERADST